MPTSDYEYTLLCSMASNREQHTLNNLGEATRNTHHTREATLAEQEWRSLPTSEEFSIQNPHGYFGVAYIKVKPGTREIEEIVIAHRGTCFNKIGNILADIEIAQGIPPKILEAATSYLNTLFAQYPNINPTKITHTGFSLGGFIAGACAGLSNCSKTHAVTFDAPGIAHMKHLFSRNPGLENRIVNYVTIPNLVNTCNAQVGSVRQIHSSHLQDGLKTENEVAFELNLSDLGLSSLPELASMHTSTDLLAWLNEKEKQELKSDNTNKTMAELTRTLYSHNLGEIINTAQAHTEKMLPYCAVFQWPTASNTLIYDSRPHTDRSLTTYDIDGILSLLLNLCAVTAQAARHVVVQRLWEHTQKVHNGQIVGIVGICHTRCNSIYYTATDFWNASIPKITAAITSLATEVLRHLETPSGERHAQPRTTPGSATVTAAASANAASAQRSSSATAAAAYAARPAARPR